MKDPKAIDKNEAPEGYHAVLKVEAKPKNGSNICKACDWRKTCQDPKTDFADHNHRCMSVGVILHSSGGLVNRKDGCGVLFKKHKA